MSKLNELFDKKLEVVNLGIESFYQDLKKQDVPAVHVNWKPIAGGDAKVAAYLRQVKSLDADGRIEAANKEALSRILAAQPSLVGMSTAGEAIPGMTKTTKRLYVNEVGKELLTKASARIPSLKDDLQ
ncbi:MAG: hypothetical protein IKI38_01105 [Mogibacterium sp.]|nr:hypothetical protein [Mogibacterium sp.]